MRSVVVFSQTTLLIAYMKIKPLQVLCVINILPMTLKSIVGYMLMRMIRDTRYVSVFCCCRVQMATLLRKINTENCSQFMLFVRKAAMTEYKLTSTLTLVMMMVGFGYLLTPCWAAWGWQHRNWHVGSWRNGHTDSPVEDPPAASLFGKPAADWENICTEKIIYLLFKQNNLEVGQLVYSVVW